ncbi:MAG: PA0069 family radical SAM protein [Acidobacteriota bacterium]|nr:PA0069 family radical SAM protein [Acidobacteriota bacterium]
MRRNLYRGRGAPANPEGRFETLEVEADPESAHDHAPRLQTRYLRDDSRTILVRNSSPDLSFDYSLNPYRGCEHGCAYCYARPTHEYLGFSAGLDFECRILVKEEAPALLREALGKRSWRPKTVAMSGVTDCYQPVERRLRITRGCLEVFAETLNPVGIVTKNHLVTRDMDLLGTLATVDACAVTLSIPTLDPELARVLEPRASAPARRLAAVERLSTAGIRTGVLVAPVIPGLTEHEIPEIVKRAATAGASGVGYVLLRLPWGLKSLFEQWLRVHRPQRAERVLARIRDVRDGELTDNTWGRRHTGSGTYAGQIATLFKVARARNGLDDKQPGLSTASFQRPVPPGQGRLF